MRVSLFLLVALWAAQHVAAQVTFEKSWTAEELFAASRSSGMMLDGGRITLEDHVLVEDDGPACGYSSDPSSVEILKEGIVLRKTIVLDRLPARAAWVTAMFYPDNPPEPNNGRHVIFTVNGHDVPCEIRHFWTHVSVPPSFLKTGENLILVRTMEPDTRFRTWVALERNYPVGSETRLHHPNRSARSTDGGVTFDDRHLGVDGKVDGEYSIRVNLGAYRPDGWLESPVVDLAEDSALGVLQLPVEFRNVLLEIRSNTPDATGLRVETRTGGSLSQDSDGWSSWRPYDKSLSAGDLRGRYLQFRVQATSARPDRTPALAAVRVRSVYAIRSPAAVKEYRSIKSERYPRITTSFAFEYENPTLKRLQDFRARMNLDSVVRDARTEFERMLKIKGWVARQWNWHLLRPDQDLMEWEADRIMTPGADGKIEGGFCLHYAIVLMQALQSFGIPARIVSVDYSVWGGHEVVEAWSNEFGKWVFLDADFDTYFIDRDTGVPLNALDMHQVLLREYFPGEAIDRDSWSRQDLARRARAKGNSPPVIAVVGGNANSGTLTSYEWWNPPVELTPYCGGYGPLVMGYLRYMPRANYLSKPRPVPVNHGRTHWGWTGYYCWYDAQTPRALEHPTFTNRSADLYWNLNQIDYRAEVVSPGVLRIEMVSNSPFFKEFQITLNGTTRRTTDSSFEVVLGRGLNSIEMRVVDSMGNLGSVSTFACVFTPATEQN